MYKLLGFALLVSTSITPVFSKTAEAIFAGGCFWSMEADFSKVHGVLEVISGYDGGTSKDPTYSDVSKGKTGYMEAVRIVYNPAQVTYKKLVNFFWRHIDPTVKNGQFCDIGNHYQTAIFYLNDKQKDIALTSKTSLSAKFDQIFTKIVPSTQFYAAEDYHQNYYRKNPLKYKYYRWRCGRDAGIMTVWQHAKK